MIRFQMGEEVVVKFQGSNVMKYQGKVCRISTSLENRFPSYEVRVRYKTGRRDTFTLTTKDNLQFPCKHKIPPWMVYKLEEA